MNLGDKIRVARENRELSVNELARRIGVSGAHISNIENNKSTPSLELLQKISDVLNVHISTFFIDEKMSPPSELEAEGIEYIAIDRSVKENITEEDIKKAIEFVRDLKSGKFDMEKLNKINL